MSAGKMERSYFDEKKEYALEGLDHANTTASYVVGMLSSWNYDVPNIIDPAAVHEHIQVAKAQLDGVRTNFEKLRWASANTDVDFDTWLQVNGCADLIRP
jgi:hypothetical protein